MTITSVRFYFYPNSARREQSLSRRLWGFAEWFEVRLKPVRAALRGPEVKGVNIVNFCLYEDPARMVRRDGWWQRMNSLEYAALYDLAALSKLDRLDAIAQLMAWAAPLALAAPWPQLAAVGRALAAPLDAAEQEQLLPYLQWPRGEVK